MSRDRDQENTRIELQPGYFFSPGFYMAYWRNCIQKTFAADVILKHNKLKQHREMWVGAIMAAANTAASKRETGEVIRYYVGLPDDEPSDVDIARPIEKTMPNSGRVGTVLERLNIQIIRCDLNSGETLLGQVMKKNQPAYSGLIVAVYVYGGVGVGVGEFESVHNALQEADQVYPSSIISVHAVSQVGSIFLPGHHYGLSQLYPGKGLTVVDGDDPEAFFRSPDAFRGTGAKRGVSTEWYDLGTLTLLPPRL